MRLVNFWRPDLGHQTGALVGDRVVSLASAGFPDLLAVLSGGAQARAKIEGWIHQPPSEATFELNSVQLFAPVVLPPPKLIFVGLNYRDHAQETGMAIPKVPTIFSKFANAIIGPEDAIVLPKNSAQVDYEAEFAFVIGSGGRHLAPDDWTKHVFGYTIVNDVSARDFQMATSQWMMGKTFDTFAPIGPWIVTADEIADPHALDINLRINGETLQSSNTRELIFKIPDLIAHLSSVMTLEPGDIVSTGTPAGVGFARKPPRFLREGDQLSITVAGIGELRNPVVAES